MKYIIFFLSLSILFIMSCTYEKASLPPAGPQCDSVVHYDSTAASPHFHSIKSIVTSIHCQPAHGGSGCHEAGSSNGDYTSYDALKTKADNGHLLDRVYKLRNMPADQSLALSEADILRIYCWVQQGAPNN
jgi:hypothetical protein